MSKTTLKLDGHLFKNKSHKKVKLIPIHRILSVTTGTSLHLRLMRGAFSNRPRSIYQYSNMAPRLSGLTSIFGVVFFVSKSLLGIEGQKKLEKFAILTRKPRSHA